MFYRVSTDMPNDNMQFFMKRREALMNRIQGKMAEQTRVQELRDSPISAAHSTRFQSHIKQLERYTRNIETLQGRYQHAEGKIRSTLDILHRVRELSIGADNGIYSRSELRNMAKEVDELLKSSLDAANSKAPDGTTLFSGYRANTTPFRAIMGRVEGSDEQLITSVEYIGDGGRNRVEIQEGRFIEDNFPGNKVFWAENQEIYATPDATAYQVREESEIIIDGHHIKLNEGDTVYNIMDKINASEAAVKASLDPVRNSLVLKTRQPHQMMLEDGQGSSVFKDLGIVSQGVNNLPPHNYAENARVFGGSLFDQLITVRDALYRGDIEAVGGAGIRGIDLAMDNILDNLAELGAQDLRATLSLNRIEQEIPDTIAQNSREVDLDMAEAITELKQLELTHKAALATAARIVRPTLLDFLR